MFYMRIASSVRPPDVLCRRNDPGFHLPARWLDVNNQRVALARPAMSENDKLLQHW